MPIVHAQVTLLEQVIVTGTSALKSVLSQASVFAFGFADVPDRVPDIGPQFLVYSECKRNGFSFNEIEDPISTSAIEGLVIL